MKLKIRSHVNTSSSREWVTTYSLIRELNQFFFQRQQFLYDANEANIYPSFDISLLWPMPPYFFYKFLHFQLLKCQHIRDQVTTEIILN